MVKNKIETPVLCYPGQIFVTSRIGSTARIVLDAIFALTDTDNMICFDEQTVKALSIILKKCEKDFTEQTIRNSVSELYKNEILLRLKNNTYYLNPIYFIKNTIDHHQYALIKKLHEAGLYDKINIKAQDKDNIDIPAPSESQ